MAEGILHRQEIVVLTIMLALGLLWVFYAIPFFTTDPGFLSMNPVQQYVLYNAGQVLLWVSTFGVISVIAIEKRFEWQGAFVNALTGQITYSWVYDMWQPPNYLDSHGSILISNVTTGVGASVDRMWAFIFQSLFPSINSIVIPLNGGFSLLYVAVYLLVPILTLIGAAIIFTRGKFISWIAEGLGVGK